MYYEIFYELIYRLCKHHCPNHPELMNCTSPLRNPPPPAPPTASMGASLCERLRQHLHKHMVGMRRDVSNFSRIESRAGAAFMDGHDASPISPSMRFLSLSTSAHVGTRLRGIANPAPSFPIPSYLIICHVVAECHLCVHLL